MVSVPPTSDHVRGPAVPPMPAAVTVTLQVAVLLPSTVVTVITALPAPVKLTTPLDTVATDELLVDHVTALFVAVDGLMAGVRVTAGAPTVLLREV
jgi:hypothetical protein